MIKTRKMTCIYDIYLLKKYLFAVEHAFETRPGKKQKVWFDTTEDRSEFQRIYRENSEAFDKGFSFSADEL